MKRYRPNFRSASDAQIQQLAELLLSASQEFGLEMPIRALCDAVYAQASAANEAAASIKGDGFEGGDADKRANYLVGVYEQLRAAHSVASEG